MTREDWKRAMITRIEALNYRCLRYVAQDLGPFHILVGPNASGKSAFLDVPALVRDIVRDGRQDIAEPICSRAANYTDLFWRRGGPCFELAVEAGIPEERRSHLPSGVVVCRYELGIGEVGQTGELGIRKETLSVWPRLDPEARRASRVPKSLQPPEALLASASPDARHMIVQKLFSDGKDYMWPETKPGTMLAFRVGHRRSALANMPEDDETFPVATWFKQFLLTGIHTIALSSAAMRGPSPPAARRSLQTDGASLPWLFEQLPQENYDLWLGHLRTELPDLASVRVVERPEDRHRYLVLRYKDGLELPAWCVSDGTLHLMALALLPYLPGATPCYLIEEPENCIHPTAIQAAYECLTSIHQGQVLLATHSPAVLGLAQPEQMLCFSRSEQEGARIVPGNEHRILKNWRGEVSLDVLFASGVLG